VLKYVGCLMKDEGHDFRRLNKNGTEVEGARLSEQASPADLQREVLMLQREEAKLIVDIKKAAKQNQTASMKTLAKSLVRLRGQMNQLRASETQLRGVKTTITVTPSPPEMHHLRLHSEPADVRYPLPSWRITKMHCVSQKNLRNERGGGLEMRPTVSRQDCCRTLSSYSRKLPPLAGCPTAYSSSTQGPRSGRHNCISLDWDARGVGKGGGDLWHLY